MASLPHKTDKRSEVLGTTSQPPNDEEPVVNSTSVTPEQPKKMITIHHQTDKRSDIISLTVKGKGDVCERAG